MIRNYYLPKDESSRADLLEHLALRLPDYLGTLELTDVELDALRADALAYRHTLAATLAAQAHARQWTAFKKQQFDGKASPLPYPDGAVAVDAVPDVPAGIIPRLARLVARIKTARNYTEGIGHELGIIGSARRADTERAKPILKIALNAGRPVIRWTKSIADSLEIHRDRGDSQGFVLLTIAHTTRVPDPTPLPAGSANWQYKAIYRLKDERIGNWSDVVSIVVGG